MKIAIVCSAGIGDGLLMQIAARHLQRLGCETVTFSKSLSPLSSWVPGFRFEHQPALEEVEEQLAPFDAVLLQHNNTLLAKKIRALPKPVYVFYGSHLLAKHGPLRPPFDVQFDPTICMAKNIRNALKTLFPGIEPTLENGLSPPSPLKFRRFEKRIALHATSAAEEKNWPKNSFLRLKEKLQQQGWDPVFIAPALFPHLTDLAAFIFESGFLIGNDSGPGHLASNLGLPTVIIGPSREHLSFWRPGWHLGTIAYPPPWTGKMKMTRKNWKFFVTVNNVIKQFMKLTEIK
jgi:ADP-heptose:LPS heptosyltransferase